MLYRERLTVPLVWWLLAVGFAVSLLSGFWVLSRLVVGARHRSGFAGRGGAIFQSSGADHRRAYRAARRASGHRTQSGEHPALDADETSRRSGTEADARAHLVLRPYVRTAVELTLDDPADPVPYWLVSTRRPQPGRGDGTRSDRGSPRLAA